MISIPLFRECFLLFCVEIDQLVLLQMSQLKKSLRTDNRTCTPAKSDAYLSLNPFGISNAFVTVLVDTLLELLR